MDSKLRELRNKHIDKAHEAWKETLANEIKWTIEDYHKGPITAEYLKEMASRGCSEVCVYERDWSNGTMSERYQIGNNYDARPWAGDYSRLENTPYICNAVKNMFEEINKKNEWNLKIESNCNPANGSNYYVKAKW